jgi:hypothetical protein
LCELCTSLRQEAKVFDDELEGKYCGLGMCLAAGTYDSDPLGGGDIARIVVGMLFPEADVVIEDVLIDSVSQLSWKAEEGRLETVPICTALR